MVDGRYVVSVNLITSRDLVISLWRRFFFSDCLLVCGSISVNFLFIKWILITFHTLHTNTPFVGILDFDGKSDQKSDCRPDGNLQREHRREIRKWFYFSPEPKKGHHQILCSVYDFWIWNFIMTLQFWREKYFDFLKKDTTKFCVVFMTFESKIWILERPLILG